MKIQKLSLPMVGFLQAVGLTVYCSLVSVLFWQGNKLFGNVPNYLGPFLFLVIFTTSALISALITLGYPFLLFWEKKQTREALRLVGYTAGWLVFIAVLILTTLLIIRL